MNALSQSLKILKAGIFFFVFNDFHFLFIRLIQELYGLYHRKKLKSKAQ